MKISEFSVKNYQFTIIIFVMVMALGISSLLTMPRGEDPPFNAPYFVVIAVYPGTSPNDMEELVADPIEEKLNEEFTPPPYPLPTQWAVGPACGRGVAEGRGGVLRKIKETG